MLKNLSSRDEVTSRPSSPGQMGTQSAGQQASSSLPDEDNGIGASGTSQ